MSETELSRARRLIERQLRHWRPHPDWDDLCQEAMLNFWQLSRADDGRYPLPFQIRMACRGAIVHWLRSPRCLDRRSRHSGTVMSVSLFLDLSDREEALLPQRDPTEEIIARLAARQQAEIALAAMTGSQRRIILLSFWGEVPINRIARVLGLTYRVAWYTRLKALERGREALATWSSPSPCPARKESLSPK